MPYPSCPPPFSRKTYLSHPLLRGHSLPPFFPSYEKRNAALTYSLYTPSLPVPRAAPRTWPRPRPAHQSGLDLARLPIGSLSIVYRPDQTARYVRRGRSGPLFWVWLWCSGSRRRSLLSCSSLSCSLFVFCLRGTGVLMVMVVLLMLSLASYLGLVLPLLLPLPCRDATQRRMLRMLFLCWGYGYAIMQEKDRSLGAALVAVAAA